MLDVVKIRHFYFHPPPDDPEHESTPEELWASAERQEVEECLLRGGDPRAEGLGEHGSLIGGPVKPARCFGFNPEKRLPRNPLPLSRFDHPRARATPPATPENPDLFFAGLSASYLAGYPNRPHGAALGRMFRTADLTPVERDQLWHIFACIHTKNLVRLLARAASPSIRSPAPSTSLMPGSATSLPGSTSSPRARNPPTNRPNHLCASGRGAPEAAKVSSPVINKQIRAMPGRQGRRKQLSPAGTSGPPAADRR